MKKQIFILAITIVVAGTLITGCQSSASKVEEAQAKVNEAQGKADVAQGKADIANQALDQAIKDSSSASPVHTHNFPVYGSRWIA